MHDLGFEEPAGDEAATTRLSLTLPRASVGDAPTSRHDALERLAALPASSEPGEQIPRLSFLPAFGSNCLPRRARLGATLELGQDLGALSQTDDPHTCTNRFAVLIPTELACV
jgi:hypothetical protein